MGDDIEKLVKDAEKYKAEDEVLRKKVEGKNSYENYIYTVRNTLTDEKLKDKFSDEDKTAVEEACKTHQAWLDSNPDASGEEYESKYKELESTFQPIMTKIYQSMPQGEQGMPGGMPGMNMPGGMGGMGGNMGGQDKPPTTNV